MREWELKEGGILLLGAPPRVKNQIEMWGKPPSNVLNFHSRPKGGDHQSGTPYFGLFLIISISMKREGAPPRVASSFFPNTCMGGPFLSLMSP